MKYLSVCSGIEAASVAWKPISFEPVAFAEIEPFPCSVLKHHYPTVPNLGDITKFKDWPNYAIDILVGGTPCQSFSVAGLRKGMDDPRGNLALTFLAIADRYAPRWICWENVPGVLSSDGGRDFGSFLGGLAAIGYGFAYRVLDAQFFGLAQRRKRVFVVGHSGGQWQRAAAVLFERKSLCGHPAPCRETGQRIAPTISARTEGGGGNSEGQRLIAPTLSARTKGGGGLGTDFDCDGGLIARPLLAKANSSHDESEETYVPEVIPIQEIGKRHSGTPMNGVGHGAAGDPMFTLQSSVVHGVCVFDPTQVTSKTNRSNPQQGDPCHTLAKNAAAPLIAFSSKDSGSDAAVELAPTLRAGTHDKSHANSGSHIAIAHTLKADGFDASEDGTGRAVPFVPSLARCVATREGTSQDYETTTILPAGKAVRRLTPKECERLMGFPDDWTKVPYRGKQAEECADGNRYKALGNSFAVPVVRWIGERIALVDKLSS